MRKFFRNIVNNILLLFNRNLESVDKSDPFRVQRNLLRISDPVIFDVGANRGDVCLQYRKIFPHCTIYAFEPFPVTFESLKKNLVDVPNIYINQLALSDTEDTIPMNSNLSSATNSILGTDPRASQTWGGEMTNTVSTVNIQATTIDSYCKKHAISYIHILKLDIQGAELKALQGAAEMLEKGQVELIYMELILGATYLNQPRFEDYLRFFTSTGYALLGMFNQIRRPFGMIQADVIFVRR